ncbi:hypothetical protein EXIGLDRAFT_360558 [Exidia glandulosa HHB12029]|uniref:RING-type domain-containing protein n=1 Tax=Exidia glandulosa HHB12029 TaxID=1314781 RepID=A0A165C667_EXIGL|nr:hypothetical protein EXIGLDRAFT_360558 [Exidia glandulosa HHB12029]
MQPVWLALGLVAWSLVCGVGAYIPAHPFSPPGDETPQTHGANMSKFTLQWPPRGSYSNDLYYLLADPESQGLQEGVLVHFSEKTNLTNITMPSLTPWIAFIQCDHNATNASDEIDIFTYARDRGAVAALLFSNVSETCAINDEYTNPDEFERVLDVFAISDLYTSKIVQSQFSNINQTLYADYNPTRINASAAAVHADMTNKTGDVAGPYLLMTLRAFNATANQTDPDDGQGQQTSPPPDPKGQTGLAMIILYAITGCVSLLFCIVIAAGAIRAIRHPERYGPRAADPTMGPGGQGQSRAGGLTRAILDTFPVIKYAVAPAAGAPTDPPAKPSDEEEGRVSDEIQLKEVSATPPVTTTEALRRLSHDEEASSSTSASASGSRSRSQDASPSPAVAEGSRLSMAVDEPAAAAHVHGTGDADVAAAAAVPAPDASTRRAACPICILDFEEGEDVRVLPCKGHHMFHRECVDPWLLDSSGSCPLCREDFHELENALEDSGEGSSQPQPEGQRRRPLTGLFRFKRRPTSTAQPMDDNDLLV